MEWYLTPFRKYADFTGRVRRKEYWLFNLFNAVILIAMLVIGVALEYAEYSLVPLGVYFLAIIVPSFALTVRRLHDQGKSGWYFMVRFIPFIGGIWFLVLMCTDGENYTNQYGLNPKNPVDNEINDIGTVEV